MPVVVSPECPGVVWEVLPAQLLLLLLPLPKISSKSSWGAAFAPVMARRIKEERASMVVGFEVEVEGGSKLR